MARDRVDRFLLAAKALGAAGIEQQDISGPHRQLYLLRAHPLPIISMSDELFILYLRQLVCGLMPFSAPLLPTTVEYRYTLMPQPAQEPPQPNGHRPTSVVISHHLGVLIDAPFAQFFCQCYAIRQRVTSTVLSNRRGEIPFQMSIPRTRDMRVVISPFAGPGIDQVEATVNNDPRWLIEFRSKCRGIDQGAVAHANSRHNSGIENSPRMH